MRVQKSGFRVQGFEIQVLGSAGFKLSGPEFGVLCFTFPGFDFRVSGTDFKASGLRFRVSGFGFRVLVSCFYLLCCVIWVRILVPRIRVSGVWVLGMYWLIFIGRSRCEEIHLRNMSQMIVSEVGLHFISKDYGFYFFRTTTER